MSARRMSVARLDANCIALINPIKISLLYEIRLCHKSKCDESNFAQVMHPVQVTKIASFFYVDDIHPLANLSRTEQFLLTILSFMSRESRENLSLTFSKYCSANPHHRCTFFYRNFKIICHSHGKFFPRNVQIVGEECI